MARVIREEERNRYHLVVALGGAHAFGFPSPDSGLDLKAIHIEQTAVLLGMAAVAPSVERVATVDGVEIDYTSNEIKPVLLGILHGNGNYVERVLGHLRPHVAQELADLAPLVQRTLSRRLYRHYTGFATSQVHAYRMEAGGALKSLLYVLRTTLTGAHVLATGRVVVDLLDLIDEYGFADARELLILRRLGESAALEPGTAARWEAHLSRAFATLEAARDRSVLPEAPEGADELEAWLVAERRKRL
jgi:predicted nucleotidyltransferase